MSYKTIIKSIIIVFVIGLIGYKILAYMQKIEINTVSPQTSNSSIESRRNGFFKQSYILDTAEATCKINIKEAWIEDVWKNSFNNDILNKEKLGGVQLAINASDFSKCGYDCKSFLVDWNIRLDKQELQGGGKGNGLYVFYLKDTMLPEKIKLTIYDKSEQNNKQLKMFFQIKKVPNPR